MLVVTRKIGESIIIRAGKETITVSVEALHGGNVRIGLDAPSHVQILRNELIQNREEFDKVLKVRQYLWCSTMMMNPLWSIS